MTATSPPRVVTRQSWVRRVALVGVAVLLLLFGYQVVISSTWNAHDPEMVDGMATRDGDIGTMAVVEKDDGTHLWFQMEGVVWKSGQRTGEDGIPPCLREPDVKAAVQVGVIEVARPFGSGSYTKVLSVTCL